MKGHDIIVVGGSAGALEALVTITRALPSDLPAALFVVIHASPSGPGLLPQILGNYGRLPAAHVRDREPVRPGRIYVAALDHHLILEPGRVRVTRGPKENRFRPAVDPLFRSAALAYGPRVAGVVLSGGLDDGAAGLWTIKARGGVAIVQDPNEALHRSMPESALRQTRVDYRLRAAEIAPVLTRLAAEPAGDTGAFPVPEGLETETRIAMDENALDAGVMKLGEPTVFTCPECHGTLQRLKQAGGVRFRCHVGHAFTADALLAELTESVEGTLWTAFRSVEESSLLMEHIATHVRNSGDSALAAVYERKAAEARQRGELVRRVIMGHESFSEERLADEA